MSEPTATYRYPGIQPFTTEQREIFFGRDDDREQLLSLIRLEKLVVLFGKSGYGKSSLLNAGIAPGLLEENRRGKRQYIPIFIRFHAHVGAEAAHSWFDKFVFDVAQAMPDEDPTEQARRDFLPPTLWGELKRRQTQPNQVFVLIFDQFEELFTYPTEQQEAFKAQLADLLYADVPAYLEHHEEEHSPEELEWLSQKLDAKAVFSIRADRLSKLDRLKDRLPGILNKRYELRALSSAQAQEALEKPACLSDGGATRAFKSPVFAWQPEATAKVLTELSRDAQGREMGIEAFQLQIVAQNIENRVIYSEVIDRDGDGVPDVTEADLPSIDSLYEDFYEDALKTLSSTERDKARKLIEEGLIFEQDHQRINLHEKIIKRDFGVDEALVKKMIDLRLVRAEPSTSGGNNIELSHDSFVGPILAAKERREEAKRMEELKLLEAMRERERDAAMPITFWLAIIGAIGSLIFVGISWFFDRPDVPYEISYKNRLLTQQLDSIKIDQDIEEEAKKVVKRYFDCVNYQEVDCASTLMTDTLTQYYTAKNLPRAKREKLERNYYRQHPAQKGKETQVKDLVVEKKGRIFEVTATTDYYRDTLAPTPVIFKMKLNSDYKIFYLRSFIAAEAGE